MTSRASVSVFKPFKLHCLLVFNHWIVQSVCLFQYEELKPGRDCVLECGPDQSCFTDTCCGKRTNSDGTETGSKVRQRSIGNKSGFRTTASDPGLRHSIRNEDDDDNDHIVIGTSREVETINGSSEQTRA